MENDKEKALLAIFLEEATDLIASLSTILGEWEGDLQDFRKIADLKRELHTLKGAARMVGHLSIGSLAHEMETLSEALTRSEIKINRDVFELMTVGLDQIAMIIEAAKKQETLPEHFAILERFHRYLQSNASMPVENAKTGFKNTKPIENKMNADSKIALDETQPLEEEMIRIRSGLLEKLNNLSTESNVFRMGFEQQILSFGSDLRDLRSQAKHLENQLETFKSELQGYVSEAAMTEKMVASTKTANIEYSRYVHLEQMLGPMKETTLQVMKALEKLNESKTSMESLSLNQTRVTSELEHRLSDARLVPFNSIVPRLGRIVRQVSNELKKQVNFHVIKSEGEMDRTVLEHLLPSLEHILRNALDHGIESIEVREKQSKPSMGTIEINFMRRGSIVAIEVKDDGAGIDPNRVRSKAIELGRLSKDNQLSDQEVLRYILEPGFSTRETITELSGRGVGLDVVANAVKELGGTLNIVSELGKGTDIIIRFPFTTSLNRILLFTLSNEILGFLLSDVSGIISLEPQEFQKIILSENPILNSGGKSYHLHYLNAFLKMDENIVENAVQNPSQKNIQIILIPSVEFPLALVVDDVLYSRELLLRALGAQFKLTELCSGATFLGNGQVVYILDPETLRKKAGALEEQKSLNESSKNKLNEANAKSLKERPSILVVDDSASARAIAKRLLEKYQYTVVTATDGLDALQKLESYLPDLLMLDVDMPKMDGFELASVLRANDRYKHIPIVVLTALVNRERRRLAKEMQLEGFLAKPYEETQLLLAIQALIGKAS